MKPRERLLEFGEKVLSNSELIALIFGRGIKGEDVFLLSQKLLSQFKSLEELSKASIYQLRQIKGIGLAKACQIKAALELANRLKDELKLSDQSFDKDKDLISSPKDIFEKLKTRLNSYHKEHFFVICLDNRNKIIAIEMVSLGILNSNLVHPRETFEVAIRHHSAQIVICHNHPSGDPEPSEVDIEITQQLIKAGKILNIEVIDHIIIGKNSYFSFKEKGLIGS